MGVLNVTPDSFSDGGRHLDPDAAVEHGLAMAEAGADILDVGGESTRPGAPPVDPATQRERVVPVVRRLARAVDVPISVDTWRADVAEASLDVGARMINDISALRLDAGMAGVVARAGAALVLMHCRSTPADMQVSVETAYGDVVREVTEHLAGALRRAVDAGIDPERTVVDPGIGFGKTVGHNLELLARLDELAALGRPVLVGTSRKSFLGALTGRPVERRLAATLASVAAAVLGGASIVRVHDVAEAVDAVRVAEAVRDGGTP